VAEGFELADQPAQHSADRADVCQLHPQPGPLKIPSAGGAQQDQD
jgi:hypothetical protein